MNVNAAVQDVLIRREDCIVWQVPILVPTDRMQRALSHMDCLPTVLTANAVQKIAVRPLVIGALHRQTDVWIEMLARTKMERWKIPTRVPAVLLTATNRRDCTALPIKINVQNYPLAATRMRRPQIFAIARVDRRTVL